MGSFPSPQLSRAGKGPLNESPIPIPQFPKSPRKLQHTPGAQFRQSPYPTMKGFPLQPIGKGLGVCSKGVLKQP